MWLTTEEFGDLPEVEPETLAQILLEDGFGKFAILNAAEDIYLQAGNCWSPDDVCTEFLKRWGSDPWILEYHDGPTGKHFQALGHFPLPVVVEVFLSYLSGNQSWRENREWQEIKV
ncbi:MAG: hypothetical protein K1Y36_27570 [Blastocatellia bacterium]|nr:hypothetical protein [Blastocatellia bacterium]